MSPFTIQVIFNGAVSNPGLAIDHAQFTVPFNCEIAGLTGVRLEPQFLSLACFSGTAIGGMLTLSATPDGSGADPVLRLNGSCSPAPQVQWLSPDGRPDQGDLSSGQLVLTGVL